MDYADGTLWFGTQQDLGSAARTFYQFSTTGTQLGTQQYSGLTGNNYLGGEFAFAAAPVPEPSTLSLIGLGLIGLGAMKRRRRYG
jgi:PEP-CTERM motif